jgi:galactokinase
VIRAPGRVNLLGEHVDYNDGWVLPAALTRAAWLAVAPSDAPRLDVHAADIDAARGGARAVVALEGLEPGAVTGWPAYPAGVAWALRGAGHAIGGLQAALASDVPAGAGLSSSAAVELAFAWAWREIAGLPLERSELAVLARRAENEFVGVACGIMDQFAVACSRAGEALWLDCRQLTFEGVAWPPDAAIVIADSRAPRTLAGSAYNQRRAECAEAVALLAPHLPGLRALRDVSTEEFTALAHVLPEPVRSRARHVVEECARVLGGVEDLRAGDVAAFGAAMRASHVSLRDDYAVSSAELDALAEEAWALPGCYGARLTGAGFGGCTVSLVATEAVDEFSERLRAGYRRRTGREALVYSERPGGGVATV